MATKKQKREEALRRRQAFEEEQRQSGLRALASERAARERENLAAWEENHEKNHSWSKRIVECPHCQLELKKARDARRNAEHADGEPATDSSLAVVFSNS